MALTLRHGILHRGRMKEAFDNFRLLLRGTQISPDIGLHLLAALGPAPPHCVLFDVVVQKLVRIQFGAVGRQRDQSDLLAMLLRPLPHLRRVMHWMAVDDQIDPAPGAPHQATHELDEHGGRKGARENHEAQGSAIGERGDDVKPPALARAGDHRRLTLAAIAGPGLMIAAQPHLVAPMDFGLFLQGLLANRGILRLEPMLNFLGILLPRLAHRFLRRQAPVAQPLTHADQRDAHAKETLHQGGDSLAGPQDKRQAQLVGGAAGDLRQEQADLVRAQQPLPLGSALRVGRQALVAGGVVLAEPAIDRRAGHAEQMRGLALGHAFAHGLDRSPTNGFLSVGAQSSGILDFHNKFSLSYRLIDCHHFRFRISK